MKYIQSANTVARERRARGDKLRLVRVVKSVLPWGSHALPLATLGYYCTVIRHHTRFKVWQNGGTDSVRLSTHQLRLHRERLKRAGLLLQCEVRGRTYTTVMRAPISPIQQREYEDLYSTLCLKGGTTAAHQIFGALGGQMEGPQVALPRDTITALVLETADLKTIGLWTALAGQETHYNWENVTKIATVLNLSRPCVRKHLTQLEDLGLVARNSKVELNVNMLINKNLNA